MASKITNNTDNGAGRCLLKIINALVIDGSGKPGEKADIAVESDRIVAIGELQSWSADETIDAIGYIASPPFPVLGNESDFVFPRVADYRVKFESAPAALNLALSAEGIHRVFVNGHLVWRNGNHTGQYPGRFLDK